MALGGIESLLWNLTCKQMLKVSDSVLESKGSQTNIPSSPPARWCYDMFTPWQEDHHRSEDGSGNAPVDEHHPTKAVSCLASLSLHHDGVPFSLLYESSWPVALSCGGWVPSDIATTWSSWESTYLGAPMYTQVLFSLSWLLRPNSFFTRQRHMREQWRTGHHCSFEHGRQMHRDTSRELNIDLWTSVFSKVSLGTQKYPP